MGRFSIKSFTIKSKLLIIFFILATVPITIVGTFSYKQAKNTISELTIQSAMQTAKQLSNDIRDVFDDTEVFLEIGKHDSVKNVLKTHRDNSEENKVIYELFQAYRSGYKYNNNILDIYIIGKNHKMISERRGIYELEQAVFEAHPIYNALIEKRGYTQVISNYTSEYVSYKNIANIVSIGTTIIDAKTGELLGVIVVDFDTSVIEAICDKVQIADSGRFYILDKGNMIVFNPPKKFVEHVSDYKWYEIFKKSNGSTIQRLSGVDYLIVNESANNLSAGWKIFGEVPISEIMKDAYKVRDLTIGMVMICILLSIVLFTFLTEQITRPIRNLKLQMKSAENGNLEVKVHSTGNDEISDLGNSFNKMIQKIKMLLENSIKEQEDLKKAELNIMQAQINPHFLYNSLDAIVWMAEGNDKVKIIDMVTALSGFFRISLSKGAEIISIGREIEHCRNYLIIQKMRYGELLAYSIEISPDIMNFKTIKIMLQPIIENAIYHGIKNKREGGRINIKGYIHERVITFEIEDTGAGIREEQLSELSKKLVEGWSGTNEGNDTEGGFGIFNVNERIKLYFGKEYGLAIESIYGIGTKVIIKIPAVR